ncbi:hydrolase [Lachnospiraceae bacterium ZAX-1]
MRILEKNTSCIVVDYQEKLVPAMANKEQLLKNSVKLLQGLKILEIPLIITGQYTKGLGVSVPQIAQAVGTEECIDKLTFSSYENEEVKKALLDYGRNHVIVCGIEAHVCVLQTVIDLRGAGYQPILVTDCISSRKESDAQIALLRARQEGALLTTSEAILFELTRKAGTDKFKQISKLVK